MKRERYIHVNAEFQRIARTDKNAFLSDQCKEIEENNRMGKTRDLFKKIRDTKGAFHAKMCSVKELSHFLASSYNPGCSFGELFVKRSSVVLLSTFQKIASRDKKVFLSDQCKEIEEKIEWERLEISARKLEVPREHFKQRWAQ